MEASALTTANRRGLLARRSPLLKLQGDDRLIALARGGNAGAFETIVDRYQPRLLGFCRQMLGSTEDAEDVLQEVFVNAYKAMLADSREINLRPWLYRIARNRSLNHLRKPTADCKESMDTVPMVDAATTHEMVHNREEFRQLLSDVKKLPETQRTALLLREMDALSYEEIAVTMETTVPSVKSLLVRARISLAEASQARLLTCGEVRLELAEAAEGLRKVTGPVRRHVRECDECGAFRSQIRSDTKAFAAIFPVGGILALKGLLLGKLGFGAGSAASAAGAGAGAGAATVGTGAAFGTGGGISAVGSVIGAKAVAGVVTAAVLTAGAVEVRNQVIATPNKPAIARESTAQTHQPTAHRMVTASSVPVVQAEAVPDAPAEPVAAAADPAPVNAAPTEPAATNPSGTPSTEAPAAAAAVDPVLETETPTGATGSSGSIPSVGGGAAVVIVTPPSTVITPPDAEKSDSPAPEAEPATDATEELGTN